MKCELCPLHEGATKQCLPSGSTQPLVYFVGEAPGKEENEAGFPFVGRSGQYLRESIARTDLRIEQDCRFFNIARCIPWNGSGVRAPSFEEMNKCSRYLCADIVKYKPQVIVTLGSTSTSYFLQDKFTTITKCRGIVFHDVDIYYQGLDNLYYSGKFKVIPTFHPSYIIRNGKKPELDNHFYSDIIEAMSWADAPF